MTQFDRAMIAAFAPINSQPTGGLVNTVGTAPVQLFNDSDPNTMRRVRVNNRDAANRLALVLTAAGTAAVAQTPDTPGVLEIGPNRAETFVISGNQRISIVASAAATAFSAIAHDS